MDIWLAQPRGFCAGVVRAIEIVEQALEYFPPPVYVLHEIVHNRHVVNGLEARGAVFVEQLADIPPGAVVIFSAHGVATAVAAEADRRGLHAIDATCPLVSKVHVQAQRYHRDGRQLIIIGHADHPEVIGTSGRIAGPVTVVATVDDVERIEVADAERVAYVTQTTLSLDDTRAVIAALKRRFPAIQGPDVSDICYATQNRQNAVRALAAQVDVLLVVGARNSSNSNRLREVGAQCRLAAYLVENAADIKPAWFGANTRVGVTAGASAPEELVRQVLDRLRALAVCTVREMGGVREHISFRLPRELSVAPAERRAQER